MSIVRTVQRGAVVLGIALLVVAIGVAVRLWDNSQVRVHSAKQAIELAQAEAGPRVAGLPVSVETEQDFWTVHFGPDESGQMHNYLVTIWDRRAGHLVGESSVDVPLNKAN